MTKRHHSETIERFVDLEAVVAISEEEEDEEDEDAFIDDAEAVDDEELRENSAEDVAKFLPPLEDTDDEPDVQELESVAREIRLRRRREWESEAAGSSSQPRLEMFMVRTRETEDAARISANLRLPSNAFSLPACPGRAYVLAPAKADVCKALKGLPSLASAPIIHVEDADRDEVNLLHCGFVPGDRDTPVVGDWVRMRLGKHKGRLARVRQTSEDDDIIVVAIMPLLPVGHKNAMIECLFDLARVRDLYSRSKIMVQSEPESHFVWRSKTFRRGLQELSVSRLHFIQRASPRLTELKIFSLTEPEDDILALSSQDPFLRVGDIVRVHGASLSYQEAVVCSIDEYAGTVAVSGLINDGEQMQASLSKTETMARVDVHRILKVGDYVKVRFGFGEGTHGSIISLNEPFVTLLTASKGVHAESVDSITVRTAWVQTYASKHKSAKKRVRSSPPPLTTTDPWKGARVWVRVDRHYKGSVGYVLSTNPLTRTALVQRDGVSDNAPVRIDLRNLIDCKWICCLDHKYPLIDLERIRFWHIIAQYEGQPDPMQPEPQIRRARTPEPSECNYKIDFTKPGWWSIHLHLVDFYDEHRVHFSYSRYPSRPCYSTKTTALAVQHDKCIWEHSDCHLRVVYKNPRGNFEKEYVPVSALHPALPHKGKRAIFINSQSPLFGRVVTIKKIVRDGGQTVGAEVEDGSEKWTVSREDLTSFDDYDTTTSYA